MSVNENPPAVSEAAKAKARHLADAEFDRTTVGNTQLALTEGAFARFVQQVSDAAKVAQDNYGEAAPRKILAPFILPEPVDPVEEGLREAWKQALSVYHSTHLDKGSQDAACLNRLRNVLAQRGIELGKAST